MAEKERGTWGSQIDFLLSCVGFAVGLGNLWRFPYLCMRNGGGAFLIPYFFFLFLCGIPLFFLELSLGQFTSLSALAVWKFCPLMKGLGWAMAIISWIFCIYYNIIITWTLYFLAKSFTNHLPWASCDNSWNTPDCYTRGNNKSSSIENDLRDDNVTIYNHAETNITGNVTALMEIVQKKRMTSAEEFWQFNVLDLSSGIDNPEGMKWELVGCLIAAWVIVFLCICKGVQSSGKVVYITATSPYLFLTILLIRGLTLPGSADGVLFYLTPDFNKLKDFKVWGEACIQIFYSLGPAWGAIITMASYNKFNNNALRDAIIVPCMNCGTSFYAGFVIFSIIGFLAHEADLPVDKVITSGPGLAFIAYPEAVARLPIAPFWAILFFIMLIFLGLDSQFATFETVVSGLVDTFPGQLRKHKTLFTALMCLFTLLLGLPMVTKSGMYVFQILDWYTAAFSVSIIAILESVAVAWIYGVNRFSHDISMMAGRQPNIFWKISWCFTSPFLLLCILVFNCWQMAEPSYGDYEYPNGAIIFGWIEAFISLLPIPLLALHEIYTRKGSIVERIKSSLEPTTDWGPAEQNYRDIYKYGYPEGRTAKPLLTNSIEAKEVPHKVNDIEQIKLCDIETLK